MNSQTLGLFFGSIMLGLVHGIEPGHGWPVAASSALDRTNKWTWGLAASLILGIGHLVSSVAVVLLFFLVKNYFNLHQLREPVVLPGGVQIAGPIGIAAGILLIGMGIWEYVHGHSHAHRELEGEHDHTAKTEDQEHHSHDEIETDHAHDHKHSHHDHSPEKIEKQGIWGLAGFAFLLGFIHEEEFEIIGLCAGSSLCLELMIAYALTVIAGIVGMTMLLVAGFQHFEERVANVEPFLPLISASILILMGAGFISGYF